MVGIGPGAIEDMSVRAINALKESDLVVGYKLYLDLIEEIVPQKSSFSSGMRREIDRATKAVEEAAAGKKVSIVSSGDAGVYGMAGLVLEVVSESECDFPVEVIPGIPSSNAAAALLGAPLMHDHVIISLSDLLTPWETIEKRLDLVAQGDFVVALYNPKSKKRDWQIEKAVEIFLKHKSPSTGVGIVKNASRKDQDITITSLSKMLEHDIDMTTIVIIGNSTTFHFGKFLVTRRGYKLGG